MSTTGEDPPSPLRSSERVVQGLDRMAGIGRPAQPAGRWLARAWWSPPLLLVLILLIDQVQDAGRWSVPVFGLLDEAAHLSTAALVLVAVAGGPRLLRHRNFTAATLLASMAIDVDHIPLYAGVSGISQGGRPLTHSLATVVVFAFAGLLLPRGRSVLMGIAVGVALHLFRDLASGPGIPLWWPVTFDAVHSPDRLYPGALVVLAVAATVRVVRHRRAAESQGGGDPPPDERPETFGVRMIPQ